MSEVQFTIENRYLTEIEAMQYLHIGKEKFEPYRRVAVRDGKENMYWVRDLLNVYEDIHGGAQ